MTEVLKMTIGRARHAVGPVAAAGALLALLAPGALRGQEGKELPVRAVPNVPNAAEAYFSPDGRSLICQAKMKDDQVHQVYTVDIDGTNIRRINAKGSDACSFYFPDGRRIIWTSTKDHPDMPAGNWSDVTNYPQGAELYSSRLDGSDVKRLTDNAYYDAEVTVSPNGRWVVFARQIDGKMDLWRMKPDGRDQTQITRTPDWQEGGVQYMPDGETLLYRAWLVKDQGARGTPMQIFTIKHDGTGLRQITSEPVMNWAPFPAPDGKHFVFVKMLPPANFEIFLMHLETKAETRLTFHNAFDGFPSISPDGKLMAFSSSRDAAPGERTLKLYLMDVSSLKLGRR